MRTTLRRAPLRALLLVVLALALVGGLAPTASLAQNGNLPRAQLASIAPCGELAKRPAAAWNTMRLYARVNGLEVPEPTGCTASAYRRCGSPGDGARGLSTQWGFFQRLGSGLAAVPCTSNHGVGNAIDAASASSREAIATFGRQFGFAKIWLRRPACQDALHEPWHFKWCPVFSRPDPGPRLPPRILEGSGGPGQAWYVLRLKGHLARHGTCRLLRPVTRSVGPPTRRCVIRFQASHRLAGDGIVGPATWKALQRPRRRVARPASTCPPTCLPRGR